MLVRTYTATDNCGNATTATQRIEVGDNTAPVLAGVPNDITVECDDLGNTGAANVTATDNCDPNVLVEVSETQEAVAGCEDSYVLVRTYTATDNCGNAATATQRIEVGDNTAPVLVGVPNDITLECDGLVNTTAANVTATDNCDPNVLVEVSETQDATGCEDSYVLIRTYTATDNCGNVSTATQRIEVGDSTAPLLSTIPTDITVQCGEGPGQVPNVTATDNCDDNVLVEFSETDGTGGDCTASATVIRTWIATDDCGNSAIATQTVTIEGDNIAPILVGIPSDETVDCGQVPSNAAAINVTATDNCDANVLVEFSEIQNSGQCEDNFDLVRTWIATDDCGNTAIATQTISVGDNTAPLLTGVPADESVECGQTPSTNFNVAATDNCDDNIEIEFSEVRSDLGCEGSYTLTRTWVATDDCGNSSSDTQVVTVGDNTPPVISGIVNDITVECGNIPVMVEPTATDNCDSNVSISMNEVIDNGNCDNNFVVIRTWTATDNCGNETVAEQRISVSDITAPTLSGVPADINVECDDVASTAIPTVTATDNCDDSVLVEFSEVVTDTGCGDAQSIVRTWIATDNCGNSTVATQNINLGDSTNPVLSGVPADINVECGSVPNAPAVTATDNCDADVQVELIETQNPGACENGFVLIRTWIATDDCGNSVSASQSITVEDITAPVLAGVPADISLGCNDITNIDNPNVIATDNCDANVLVELTEDRIDAGCADAYQLVRTWTATDNCGNAISASQTITVGDFDMPNLVGIPASITVDCGSIPTAVNVTATDDCDADVEVVVVEDTQAGACENEYTITRTWVATDDCGNSASGTQVISVRDNIDPVLVGVPTDVTVNLNNGETVPSVPAVSATDNCDTNVTVEFEEIQTTGCTYVITRTWVATDNCGNYATGIQEITVIGDFDITIAPTDASVCAGEPIQFTVMPTDASYSYAWTSNGGSFDNSSSATPVYVMNTPGTYSINVTVTDQATGCQATVSTNVNVVQAPALDISNNGPLCVGQALELITSSGAVSYTWSGPNGFASNEQNPVINNVTLNDNGQYTVVADYGGGCISNTSTLVSISESLDISISNNTPVCEGEEIVISVNGGNSFLWSGPNGFTANTQTVTIPNANIGSHAGTYTVVVTSGAGCETILDTNVQIDRFPTATASSNTPICSGEMLELFADGGFTYQWTGPDGFASTMQNPIIDNLDLPAGNYTYSVDVYTEAGCVATATTNVEVIGDIMASITGPDNVCENETITLVATGGSEYAWVGPNGFTAAGESITINQASFADAGSYTVTVTTDDRCSASVSYDVSVLDCGCDADAWLEFTQDENCDDSNGVAVFAPSEFTYTWSDGGTGSVRDDLTDGTYTVTVIDNNGCDAVFTVVIGQSGNCDDCVAPIVNNTIVVQATCGEANGSATIMVADNPANYTYTWIPNIGTSNATGNVRENLTSGMYEVVVTDPAFVDCFTKVTFVVPNLNGPAVDDIIVDNANCNASDGSATLLPSTWMYMWSHDNFIGNTRSDLAPGNYEVAVMDINNPECPSIITVVIGSDSDFTATANITALPDCGVANGVVDINATSSGSGDYSYAWSDGNTNQSRSDLVGGMYLVIVTDNTTGCTTEVMFMLVDDVASATVTVSDGSVSCAGSTDGLVNIDIDLAADFVLPVNQLITNEAGFTFTNGNLPAGNYCVMITDGNDCVAGEGCFEVTSPDAINLDVVTTDMTCSNGGSITILTTGGSAPYTYDWADLPGTSNIEDRMDLNAGSYSVTVIDAEGCTTNLENITVVDDCTVGCVQPDVMVDIVPSSCGGFTGEILLTVDGNQDDYNFAWTDNVSTGVNASGLGFGAYEVTISLASDINCSTELMIMVPNSDGPQVNVLSVTNADCNSGGSASLSPDVLNFNWSDGGNGAFRDNLMPGTYAITATDLATNCSNVISLVIGNDCNTACDDTPVITITGVDASCGNADGSAVVALTSGSSQYMYTWTNSVSSTETASNLAAGEYSVTVVDINNPSCRAVATVMINDSGATPITIANNVSASCNNADGMVTLSPADLDYQWSDNQSGAIRDNLTAGTYTVMGTNAEGCVATISVVVTEDCGGCTLPEVTATITNTNCGSADGTIILDANTDVTYTWTPNVSTSNIASNLVAGPYEVLVADLNDASCSETFTFIISNEDGPQIAIASLSGADCNNGGTVSLEPADASFLWNDGDTSSDRMDLDAGIYTVIATDANGCDNTIEIIIPDNCDPTSCVSPVATVTLTDATCGNADGSISIVTDREVVYTWSPAVSDSASAANITAGLYSVTIADINDLSCSSTLSIMLTNSDGPIAQIASIENETCDELGVVTIVGDTNYSYSWFDGMITDTRADLVAGDYVVTVTDANGCENMIQFTVDNDCMITACTAPVVDGTITESTCGNADGTITLTALTDVIYTWTPNVSTTNTAVGLVSGIYNVVVTDINDATCSTTLDLNVTNSDGPVVTVLSTSSADCNMGGSAILGPDTFTYEWSDGFLGNERSDLPAGTYTGFATDANGCTNDFMVIIGDDCDPTICNAPVLTASITDATCGNDDGAISILVDGNTDVTFSWTPTLSTDSNLDNIPAGLYTVIATDVDDATCFSELVVVVTNSDGPLASIVEQTNATCDSQGSVVLAPDSLTYTWADNVVADVRTDLDAGAYAVTVSDQSNCTNVIQVIIGDDCIVTPPADCDAIAGNLDIDLSPVCLADTVVTISATPLGNEVVPAGFSSVYVLTTGNDLVVTQVNTTPEFDVDSLGIYRIHNLVFDTNTLDLSLVDLGVTTASEVNALLIQGGGTICASLDLLGASTLVYDCGSCEARAGSLTLAVDPVLCVDSTTTTVDIRATADGNQVVPNGFELAYILTSTNSFFVEDINEIPEFTVDADLGVYTVHAFVYDTTLFNLDTFDISGSTQVFDLNSMLLQGGGTICGELDLGGAMITIENCTTNPTGQPCTVDLIADDVVNLQTDDCDLGTDYCVPMAFVDIMTEYDLTINGDTVTQFTGCDFDTVYNYSYFNVVADTLDGPYEVVGWMVNDTTFTGNVADFAELVDSMNTWDPAGLWMMDSTSMLISGGLQGNIYSNLELRDTIKNVSTVLDMNTLMVPNGTSVEVNQGQNLLVITDRSTGCVDSVMINVSCNLPTPISGDTIFQEVVIGELDIVCIDFDSLSNIETFVNDCDGNTSPSVDFMIIDSTSCVQFTGEAIGLDTACFIACDSLGVCDTTILIVEVVEQPSNDLDIVIEVGFDSVYCLDVTLPGMIDTVFNACPENTDGNADFTMIDTTNCIGIIGLTEGVDTACIVLCSGNVCDTVNVTVTVIPEGGLLGPIAVDNDTMTIVNTPVTINVITNDTLNGEQGTIEILDDPLNGTANVTIDNEIIYNPDPSFCGAIDSFTYVLTTSGGTDTATVTVNVLCEELTVFNGFSPNGDDINDVFTILGIERFPEARVYVYNRWGNQVYFRNGGYQNTAGIAFDGTWEGSELPDGTYFYMIDTNDGEKLTGYVELHR